MRSIIVLNDWPSRPTSVRGSRCGARRDMSPSEIMAAARSISPSGRRLTRTSQIPRTVTAASAPTSTRTMSSSNWSATRSASDMLFATTICCPCGPVTMSTRHRVRLCPVDATVNGPVRCRSEVLSRGMSVGSG
jgi:hypothetical protein